jgi:hypothetical protein
VQSRVAGLGSSDVFVLSYFEGRRADRIPDAVVAGFEGVAVMGETIKHRGLAARVRMMSSMAHAVAFSLLGQLRPFRRRSSNLYAEPSLVLTEFFYERSKNSSW